MHRLHAWLKAYLIPTMVVDDLVARLTRIEAKVGTVDLVTTGIAAGVVTLKASVATILKAEESQRQLLLDIRHDLDGLDLPAEKQAAILAAIQARIVKVRAATPSPPAGA